MASALQCLASMKTINLDQLTTVTAGTSRIAYNNNDHLALHEMRNVLHGWSYATRGAQLQQQNQLTTMMLAMLAARR